jgi:predicted phage terminase large subunit-like protein
VAAPQPKGGNLTDLEYALAERCERSLHTFTVNAWPHLDPVDYIDGPHIAVQCEYLEAFVAGEIPRLLINIPPGHMKSLTVSVLLNAWAWTQPEHVGKRFMATSYRGDLALRDADKTRKLIRSSWYQERWGNVVGAIRETQLEIRKGADVKSRFENTAGGYRFSTAVSGIMGEGGDYVILDDPHNVEVAESDDNRDEVVRKIRMALPTRVRSKHGGVVVMMQRLHTRDYAGHMIADQADLVHLCLPARYEKKHPFVTVPRTLKSGREVPGDWRTEDGQLLWPEAFPPSRLEPLEIELGAYAKAGQLQQRPVPRGGGMYKLHWFGGKFVDPGDVPKGGVSARGWDLAATQEQPGKAPDYTAGVKLRRVKGRIYVENVVRFRGSPLEVRRTMKTTADQDGKAVQIDFPQDPGQAGKAQAQDIAGDFPQNRVYYSPESGSKETRQDAPAAQAEAGNVYIVRGQWNQAFIEELTAFPTGDFDDQADAFARAYHRVAGKKGKVGSGGIKGAS